MAQKILRIGLWWPTLHQDSKAYCRACDACQRIGKPSRRDDMPHNPQMTLQPFEKWAIDFVGPLKPQGKIGARYIITATKYLTRLAEEQPIKDYMAAMATKFLFENVLTRFGCLKIIMSDRGTHFLNETISALTKEFEVYHQQSMSYHSQANGTVEVFNKILETALTKTPFRLIYGMKAVMLMEYIIPNLLIAAMTGMAHYEALEERLAQLEELEEERLRVGFHQQV
eukprot:PITA_08480